MKSKLSHAVGTALIGAALIGGSANAAAAAPVSGTMATTFNPDVTLDCSNTDYVRVVWDGWHKYRQHINLCTGSWWLEPISWWEN